jgi:hypothetical protein
MQQRQKLSCASVPLLLLGCSSSVSAQNQGKRAKVHFVLIFSLCLEAPFASPAFELRKRGQKFISFLFLVTFAFATFAFATFAFAIKGKSKRQKSKAKEQE